MSFDLTQLILQATIPTLPVRSITNRLNRPLSIQFYVLVVLAGILLVVAWIAITRAYRQRYEPPTVFSDARLFDEMAVAHHLSADQRHLLTQLARAADLPSEVHLLVSPSRFSAAASRLLQRAHPPDEALRERLYTVQRRLFGDYATL